MTLMEKHIRTALVVSAAIVVLNIFAVTNGAADAIYEPVNNWLGSIILRPLQL